MATAIHQYEDKLLDFAYGELPAPEASAVESHLKSCARCSQALEQIRGVRTTMAALPMEPAPAAGLDSLLAYAEQAAARNAAAPRPSVPWWRRVVAPLAGACALALVAVVAIKTQDDGLDLSAQTAALEAQPRNESPPPPVAAAPALAQEPEAKAEEAKAPAPVEKEIAAKLKTGKVRGAVEADRGAKENRKWDSAPQREGLANKNQYEQALGETKGPAEERQQAQRQDLGDALGTAQKESKSRRESPNADQVQDFSNARGGYQAKKKAEANDKLAQLDSAQTKGSGSSAPMGVSTAAKPSAPPPPKPAPKVAAAAPADEPSAAPVANAPPAEKPAPSLGLSMPGSTGAGTGSRGTSPSAYKQAPSPSSEDESAARGADDLADRKRLSKDVEYAQRDQELVARGYLDAARSASNQGNRQEEVKQALAVLKTDVKGASRAEALSRLCTALEQLGEEGQADRYCDALLREFPNTTAARQVALRRNNAQRAAPATKAPSKRSSDEAAEKADQAEPAKAAPAADPKPASAY